MQISTLVAEDIRGIILDKSVPWETLRGSSVLITGATGSVGGFAAAVLAALNNRGFDIKVFAAGRNPEKGTELEKLNGVKFIAADIRENGSLPRADYIIHCAAVTDSAKMATDPVGVIDTELSGAKNVLEAARKNAVRGVVYTSSMEVYGITDLNEVRESNLGYLDLTAVRSAYPQSKRTTENMCACYFAQFGVPVSVVRLAMTFGAGSDYMTDRRVWAQFARCAATGQPIELHTEGKALTSFVYSADAVKAVFLALLAGKRGEIYNAAAQSLTIREFAERTAKNFDIRFSVNPPADISKMGYAPPSRWALNTDKLRALGWTPLVLTVEEMLERTIGKTNNKGD